MAIGRTYYEEYELANSQLKILEDAEDRYIEKLESLKLPEKPDLSDIRSRIQRLLTELGDSLKPFKLKLNDINEHLENLIKTLTEMKNGALGKEGDYWEMKDFIQQCMGEMLKCQAQYKQLLSTYGNQILIRDNT